MTYAQKIEYSIKDSQKGKIISVGNSYSHVNSTTYQKPIRLHIDPDADAIRIVQQREGLLVVQFDRNKKSIGTQEIGGKRTLNEIIKDLDKTFRNPHA